MSSPEPALPNDVYEGDRPAFRPHPTHRRAPDHTRIDAQHLFSEIPIFKDVSPEQLRQLARIARSREFAAGEAIIHMDEPGSTLYVIRSGRVEVVLERPTGNVVLADLGPGEFFGELSIFDGELRSATVNAVEATDTLTLGQYDVMRMTQRSPELAWALLKSLSARLRSANVRLGRALPGSTAGE